MGPIVYILGSLTTLLCAVLLLAGYKRTQNRLLLWSGLCFAGLTISNILVFIDLIVVPEIDLFTWRLFTGVIAMGFLLYGLIWEGQ